MQTGWREAVKRSVTRAFPWRRLAELALVGLVVALCLPTGLIRMRGAQLKGRVGGYEYETDVETSWVWNLRVADVWMPLNLHLAWDYYPLGTVTPVFDVQRRNGTSGAWTDLGTTTNHYFDDTGFTLNTLTQYRVTASYDESAPTSGDPAPDDPYGERFDTFIRKYADGSNWSAVSVTVVQSAATEDQTCDARIDPRYSTLHYIDFPFGSRTFNGGLFAGNASDNSSVGRSFVKFSLPALPSEQPLWCASVNGALTKSFANGNTTVGCQLLSDISWSASTLKWTNQPTFDPTSPTAESVVHCVSGVTSIDNGASYIPGSVGWVHWSMPEALWPVLTGSGACSAAIAIPNETGGGWIYLAKSEFDSTRAPCVLFAYGAPVGPIEVTAPDYICSGSSGTGTVTLDADAPAGGMVVQFGVGGQPPDNAVPPVTMPNVTVPAGQRTATFTINTDPTTEYWDPVSIYAWCPSSTDYAFAPNGGATAWTTFTLYDTGDCPGGCGCGP